MECPFFKNISECPRVKDTHPEPMPLKCPFFVTISECPKVNEKTDKPSDPKPVKVESCDLKILCNNDMEFNADYGKECPKYQRNPNSSKGERENGCLNCINVKFP